MREKLTVLKTHTCGGGVRSLMNILSLLLRCLFLGLQRRNLAAFDLSSFSVLVVMAVLSCLAFNDFRVLIFGWIMTRCFIRLVDGDCMTAVTVIGRLVVISVVTLGNLGYALVLICLMTMLRTLLYASLIVNVLLLSMLQALSCGVLLVRILRLMLHSVFLM